jgi:hypothetical protein
MTRRLVPTLMAFAAALALALASSAAAGTTKKPKVTPPPYKWHTATTIDTAALTGVQCPSTRLCVAIDNAGGVLTARSPTSAHSWTRVDVDGTTALTGLSCPTSRECVAVDSAGHVIVSADPAGGASAWQTVAVDGDNPITAIDCPSRRLCVAVDDAGNAITSTAPSATASAWTVVHIDMGLNYACQLDGLTGTQCQPQLLALSCPSASLCVATDDSGYVLVTHDPGAKAPTWTAIGGNKPAGFNGIACPSKTFCAMVNGFYGAVVTLNPRDPLAHRKTTTLAHGTVYLTGVSCPSAHVCLLDDQAGGLFVSTNPTGPASAWAKTAIHRAGVIEAVACQPKWCVAVDGAGRVSVGDRPRTRHATH